MRKMLRRNLALILSILMVAISFAGCGKDIKEAEDVVQAYFTAISGFNLDAMETCLSEGENKDMGVDTTTFERDYVQTDIYKKSVESMFKTLSNTISFTTNGGELKDEKTAVVNVTVSHSDVNQEAVDEFIQTKMDEYATKHPELAEKTELDQNDINIQVMASAYNDFVKLQPKVSKTLDVVLIKKDGKWKILNGNENKELKTLLQGIYGTY